MAFPDYIPSERSFNPGDWPVTRYTSQNGAEIRILRGSNRVNATLDLTFNNVTDTVAAEFLAHYREVKGTFETWYFGTDPKVFQGWEDSDTDELEAFPWGLAWRYQAAPEISQVKKGRSTVRVQLVAVTAA